MFTRPSHAPELGSATRAASITKVSKMVNCGRSGRSAIGTSDGQDYLTIRSPSSPGRVVEFGVAANPHAPKPVMHIQQKALRSREAPPRAALSLPIRRGDGGAATPDPGRRTCLAPMAAERVRRVGVLIYGGGESQSSQAQAASLREGLKEPGLDGRPQSADRTRSRQRSRNDPCPCRGPGRFDSRSLSVSP